MPYATIFLAGGALSSCYDTAKKEPKNTIKNKMAAYHYRRNVYRKVRRLRRAHHLAGGGLLLIAVLAVGGGVYIWQQISATPPAPASKPQSLGIYTGVPKKLYSNEIFSFTSSKDWQYSQEASLRPHRYIFYSSTSKGLVDYELRVYLNEFPENNPVNYILPVTVQAGRLMPQPASARCSSLPPVTKSNNFVPKKYQNITFLCDNASSRQVAGAGIEGGSYEIPLYNTQGKLQKIGLFFTDHSAGYRPETFKEIVESFKLK